jgi:hypothetical protein
MSQLIFLRLGQNQIILTPVVRRGVHSYTTTSNQTSLGKGGAESDMFSERKSKFKNNSKANSIISSNPIIEMDVSCFFSPTGKF